MGRPRNELANYPQVYDYYSQHRPNRIAAWLLHHGLSVALALRVVYEQEAEKDIHTLLSAEQPVVLVSNQVRSIDRFMIMGALPVRATALRKIAGRSFMPSRPPIQQPRIMRRVADGIGLVPVFHPEDEKPKKNNARHNSHPQYKEANHSLNDTCIAKIQAGENMVVLTNINAHIAGPKRIEPMANNVGRIVCATAPQPPLIPMGLYYPGDEQLRHAPTVFIGNPSTEPFKNGPEATQWLNIKVQDCLDAAIRHTMAQAQTPRR